jgi:type IV secretion system protein VirB3
MAEADPGVLDRDRLFVALSRPQMFAGVTYSFFVLNAVVTTEFFLLSKSVWVPLLALAVHAGGWLACRYEPRIFDIMLKRSVHCPRVSNHRFWRCNSYRA